MTTTELATALDTMADAAGNWARELQQLATDLGHLRDMMAVAVPPPNADRPWRVGGAVQ